MINPIVTNHKRRQRSKQGRTMLVLLILAVIVGILFAIGVIPKLFDKKALNEKEEQAASAVPVVHTVLTKNAPFSESAVLPGNIGAMQFATIYARLDGYLTKRLVDIGDKVKQGQLLAEIDSPSADQDRSQAAADVVQAQAQVVSALATLKEAKAQAEAAAAQVVRAKADQNYAAVTADRWDNMAKYGAVSLQSRDEKDRSLKAQNASVEAAIAQKRAADQQVEAAASQVHVARANVEAKQAALAKYKAQQSFKYVVAPFDGVIVARKVDQGALITAGSQSSTQELFQLAKLDILRTYVNVPQSLSRYLKPGQEAEVSVSSYPERTFVGKVTNVSGALDPQTRTRQTEIKIDNFDHALLPGMYGQIKLTVQRPENWVQVPSDAVLPRDNNLEVAVVRDGKAHYQKVILGRDFGDMVEIKNGLSDNEVVIVSPPDDLREGDPVQATNIAAVSKPDESTSDSSKAEASKPEGGNAEGVKAAGGNQDSSQPDASKSDAAKE
ncbi:MAG: efflux RND transporter periplasmic adaptor subunit [Cyanobacteria bacterium SZAS LIN-5]|nr:efflux RND transporter periplasmic adaptor subunit [Cyanobacteria bacterium SZAS LIN-5]